MVDKSRQVHGPWVPFPRPISYPSANTTDPPFFCLFVNEDWMPVVTGALKMLIRPEIWNTQDRPSLSQVASNVNDLIDSFQECVHLPIPDWHYGFSVDEGTTINFFQRIEEEALTEGTVPTRTFVIMATNPTSNIHAAEIEIWVLDDNEDYAGSHIDQIVIIGHNGQNIIHASTTDCFDELFTKDFFLIWHLTDDFEDGKDLKRLSVSALTDDLFIVIHGHGQVVCTVT